MCNSVLYNGLKRLRVIHGDCSVLWPRRKSLLSKTVTWNVRLSLSFIACTLQGSIFIYLHPTWSLWLMSLTLTAGMAYGPDFQRLNVPRLFNSVLTYMNPPFTFWQCALKGEYTQRWKSFTQLHAVSNLYDGYIAEWKWTVIFFTSLKKKKKVP